MPSRKKSKGKARKAAKEAKEAKEAEAAKAAKAAKAKEEEVAAEKLEAQLQRLVISDVARQKCEHGLVQLPADEEKIRLEFISVYLDAIFSHDDTARGFGAAHLATKTKYHSIYSSKLDTVISLLIARGTQCILYEEDKGIARLYASLAYFFENFMAMESHKTAPNMAKVFELIIADDHTIVSYYRKRIPCACLDEKYKKVKSVKKMGYCYNRSCSQPERKVERSKMLSCTRCGFANYCSVECQKAHWKDHRVQCHETVQIKAALSEL